MFSPKTVALVGASRHEGKVGNIILKNLKKSGVRVFPVNPAATEIFGLKCFHSVLDIKEGVDLAVIVVPAKIVPKIIDECGSMKIKSLMIISAGFGEVGNHELEEEVRKRVQMYGMNLVGPNCMGFMNINKGINATFFEDMPERGKISFISQSGALGSAMLDWAIDKKIGMSYFFSIGNMADVGFAELIDFLQKDRETKLIVLYMESLKDGEKFVEAAKRSRKPIAVVKSGTSSAGSKAAASHTGALAGSDKIYAGAFRQAGVVRINKLEDILYLAKCVKMGRIPLGKKLLVITNAGGPGVLTADVCEREGIELVSIEREKKRELSAVLPDNWSKGNPIDIVGDADAKRFAEVFSIIGKKTFYDAVLCLLTPQAMTDPVGSAREMIKFSKGFRPVFACFMGGRKVKWATDLLERNSIPNFQEPEDACRTISALIRLYGHRR